MATRLTFPAVLLAFLTTVTTSTSAYSQVVAFVPGGIDIDSDVSSVDELGGWVAGFPVEERLQVLGYYCAADQLPHSTDDDLIELAEMRAQRVKELLVAGGVDSERLATMAYGVASGASACQVAVMPAGQHWQGPVVGVGLVLEPAFGRVGIVRLLPGAPASVDGTLEAGDWITAVQAIEGGDWRNVNGLSLERVVSLIRGAESTAAGLRYQRAEDGSTGEVFLTRETLSLDR